MRIAASYSPTVPEADALGNDEMEAIINKAIAEADANNIKGAAVTPFVLGKVVELSEGRSLKANIALLINNAKLAGEIAVAAKR